MATMNEEKKDDDTEVDEKEGGDSEEEDVMISVTVTDDVDDHDDDGHDDHNNDRHESDEEDDDFEDGKPHVDSPSSFISELKETWQQHLFAILVAVIATFLAHRHWNRQNVMSVEELLLEKHPFLVNYQRTANISFCGENIMPYVIQSSGLNIEVMEFGIPKDLVGSIMRHLAADVLQDDRYNKVWELNDDDVSSMLKNNKEYLCLKQQLEIPTRKVIKGHSYFYSSPTVQSMYSEPQKKSENRVLQLFQENKKQDLRSVHLSFTGFAIKITNLSRKPILLYWEGKERRLVGEIGPFESLGTASQSSGQSFVACPIDDVNTTLHEWIVTADNPVLYYEPKEKRTVEEERRYAMHLLNKKYEFEYSVVARRPWLAHFPRPIPVHFMWPATYFGQKHVFNSDTGKSLEMIVESVTPRVFTIPQFLSAEECTELVQLAKKEGLKPSTLLSGSSNTRARQQRDKSTRSSSNTWVPRSSTDLADRIYRRAAHLLQIDEALLQKDYDVLHPHLHSLAESLQVVRYKKGEEYTAHHDFVYPPAFHRHQPTRFATLLLYLNDDFEGGETVFPRSLNAQFHDGITVTPRQGMAVLFYNMLPDGNMNDLSQHASKPVLSGEKWLANLWIWEPHIH